jgi:hypothetical protein
MALKLLPAADKVRPVLRDWEAMQFS